MGGVLLNRFTSVKHNYPMLSLSNTYSKKDACSPEWPALHLSLLVPIKLTPYGAKPPRPNAVTDPKKFHDPAKTKQGCIQISWGKVLDTVQWTARSSIVGGREVTAVTIIYEQLRYNQPLTCNFITNDPTVGWQTITSSADQHRWNSTKGLRTKQTITNQEEHFICDSWNKQ